jgi:hypothetical protein
VFKLRARKRTLGSLLAIGVLALATVLVPPATPTAQAAIDCPIGAFPAGIDGFERIYSDHGVAMCHGIDGGVQVAQVQIVDVAAGARLQFGDGGFTPAPDPADNLLRRNPIQAFANLYGVGAYPAYNFSVTNASFFTSTTTTDTKLSLPYKRLYGYVSSAGVAIRNTDPNSATPKMVLRLNNLGSHVQIQFFPTIYSASDAQCSGWSDCLVGFDPLEDVSGDPTVRNSRTFVATNSCWGVNASRVFILTGAGLTVRDAHDILQHFGACASMQLDGGGSTQMVSAAGSRLSPINRAIPNVLIVRYAR